MIKTCKDCPRCTKKYSNEWVFNLEGRYNIEKMVRFCEVKKKEVSYLDRCHLVDKPIEVEKKIEEIVYVE